ncbi:MAG: hemerythrin family protein, partial [Treponema sp.]|nr:hemerythrin family protein [Treponema sp.]
GLAFFDGPHRDFIDTANSLYTASLIGGWESAREPFDQAVRQIGRYVQDMGNEEVMMERTGYPGYGAHKREHRIFLRELGVQVRNYRNGLRIDVRKFVLFLRDWVLSHMGISDRTFALHLLRLRREGALTGIIMRVKRQKAGRVIIR